MRNIFDQYESTENRLTHGLACSLNEDRRLLRRFVLWAARKRPPNVHALQVLEQQIPGQPRGDGDENEESGLPDIWIHDDTEWSLMLENKIASPVNLNQLLRHIKTAERNGFNNGHLLVISPEIPTLRRSDVVYKTWVDVYEWMRRSAAKSIWARRFAEYMEVVEGRLMEDEYLKGQALTSFDGIHFDSEHEYNYLEAKRAIKLMMPLLRQQAVLKMKLNINQTGRGRKAITGKRGSGVWDFVELKGNPRKQPFTSYPHFTVSIRADRLITGLVVPNGFNSKTLRNLVGAGRAKLRNLMRSVEVGISKSIRGIQGAYPRMEIVQRHYPSIKAKPVVDAYLEFDLRTAERQRKGKVKYQAEWLEAAFDVLRCKKSNIQWVIGASFPYGSPELKSARVLDRIAGVWLACKPILDELIARRT